MFDRFVRIAGAGRSIKDPGGTVVALPVEGQPTPHTLHHAARRASALMDAAAAATRDRNHPRAIAGLAAAEDLFRSLRASRGRDRWVAEILLRRGDELRLAGRYAEAGEALTRAEKLAAADPMNPLRLASTLNAEGILAKDMGRYDLALARYEAALSIIEAKRGADHAALASVHHNLAGLHHAQGRYADAYPSVCRAVALRERSDPPDPEGFAADLSVLASVLLGLGRLDDAERDYMQSMAMWSDRYGSGHYEVAVQLNGLGAVRQAQGDLDGAERHFKAALEIKQRLDGLSPRETGALLNNLGALEMDRGQPDAAARLYEQALLRFQRALGDDHPDTLLCRENLARSRRPTRPAAEARLPVLQEP